MPQLEIGSLYALAEIHPKCKLGLYNHCGDYFEFGKDSGFLIYVGIPVDYGLDVLSFISKWGIVYSSAYHFYEVESWFADNLIKIS